MKRVVLIEDHLDARQFLRERAPDTWEILEAVDGLTGLDLVREELATLDLVILDLRLPDVAGEYLCAQIRELSRTLPILPYTGKAEALPLLNDLACLPAIIKPVAATKLTQTLAAVDQHPTPAMNESGALHFVRAQSYQVVQEQRARISGRRIVVMAADEYRRSWLSQMISPVVSPMHAESPPALRKILSLLHVTAVVGDAAMASTIAPLTAAHGIPLLLVATTPIQARRLGGLTVQRLFLSTEANLGAKLRATIAGLTDATDDDSWLDDDDPDGGDRGVVPATILPCFAATGLTMRELEALWLEHQGLTRLQIAARLGITPGTVSSHWKHAQKKVGVQAAGRKEWIAAHLRRHAG